MKENNEATINNPNFPVTDLITIWDHLKKHKHSKANIISSLEWINMVKDPGPKFKILIQEARLHGKGTDVYNTLKLTLPVAQLNGVFPDRTKSSLQSISGLAYLDIDSGDINEIVYRLKSNPYVYAFWKSVSGLGLGILIKYDWRPNLDFNKLLEELAEELQIPLDPNAKGIARCNFLSYDPDLYYNPNAKSYSPNLSSIEDKEKCQLTTTKRNNVSVVGGHFSDSELIFKYTLDEYTSDVMFIEHPYFEVYWPWTKAKKPMVVKEGERNKTMTIFINNLRLLNPYLQDKVMGLALSFNRSYCSPPFDRNEILRLVHIAYSKKDPEPVGVKIKKIWVNPKVVNKLKAIGEAKQQESIYKIEDALSELLCGSKKVTPTSIARSAGLSRTVIYKYLPLFQEAIQEYNQTLKK